ncbi:MAG: glutamine amidotransferase [Ponticaulis sp.]|nr:glutamine amidotransferase [Ponticaulis sp.]|tara:strand:- start:21134 stop:21865 length:732 start_codon:yes stop_codon:yes gene_type:complete
MRLTIIETGLPPDSIRDAYPGGYPLMFQQLLEPSDPDMTFETVSVEKGDALPNPESLDAILITGAAYGVYDETPWMRPLKEWIGFAAENKVPMVGICFGHQIIADALGGDVRKSDKGWGIGRHTYTLNLKPDWMGEDVPDQFSVGVSHQDQVLVPPADARILGGSPFAPHAALVYARGPILSFQGHPEFSEGFLADLYNARKGRPLTEAQIEDAVKSFSVQDDRHLMADWITGFLNASVEQTD